MGTFLHHRRQCLRPADDGPLPAPTRGRPARRRRRCPAVPDDVRRRPDHHRNRLPLPDPPRRKRPRRRRDFLRPHRPRVRPEKRAVLRHGRHNRENLPDRQLQTANRPRLRGRPASAAFAKDPVCRCGSRSSRWSKSAPAEAPSRMSTAWVASLSDPKVPAQIPARPVTAVAAPIRPSPTPIWHLAVTIQHVLPADR